MSTLKRSKSRIITIVLIIICALLPVTYVCDVLIQNRTHIDITSYPNDIDYGILTTTQIETFNNILEAVKNKQDFINCPSYSDKEKHEIITQIGLYFGTTERIEYLIAWFKDGAYLNLSLFEELSNDKIIIDARIDEAVSTLREGSDKYKLWQISNYIATKIVYTNEHRDTISALNGKGVCVSYTMLFYKMATRLGIKTYTCYGFVNNAYHTWNMVELNGEYLYYDITLYDGEFHHFAYINSKFAHIKNFTINDRWGTDLELLQTENPMVGWRYIMTVKELKQKLGEFDDNLIVLIPNASWHPYSITPPEIPAKSVTRGVNEMDGCVIIDNYEEDDDE